MHASYESMDGVRTAAAAARRGAQTACQSLDFWDMVVSLNYRSQNGGNSYRAPYYNRNLNIGPRIIRNLEQSPYAIQNNSVRMTVQKQYPFTPQNPKPTLPLPQKNPTRLHSHEGSGIGVLASRRLDLGVVGGWGAYSTSSVLGAYSTSSVLGTYGTSSVPGALSALLQCCLQAALLQCRGPAGGLISTFSVLPTNPSALFQCCLNPSESCAATAASSSSRRSAPATGLGAKGFGLGFRV